MHYLDLRTTRHWAIASLASGGAIASYSAFELVNRETGRAHQLHFVGGGLGVGVSTGGTGPSGVSYKLFTTDQPVSFENFDHAAARITSVNAGVVFGYSHTWLTIWDGPAYLEKSLVYLSMGGWGVLLPGGQAAVHGVMKVAYGSGNRSGVVPLHLELPIEFPPEPRMTRVQSKGREGSLLGVPNDALFDFDSYRLKPAANRVLQEAEELINARDRGRVSIHGHTDSVGDPDYNYRLSVRRAEAVKRWFVQRGVHNAGAFQVFGHGATRPVEPNQNPDGSDNPEGRKKNRRVEIHFHY